MRTVKKTSIGGQAVIEGVMMKGPLQSAMAVRNPQKEIVVEVSDNKGISGWYRKVPVIRGVFNFVIMLIDGYQYLMKSAKIAGWEEVEEQSEEKKKSQNRTFAAITAIASVAGVALALLLFMYLPSLLVGLLRPWIDVKIVLSLIEGVIKIIVLVAYMFFVSRLSEIHRVFEYHGAEHKSIACYEAGDELTVTNAKAHRRFHPRCGTSFIFIALIISILVFSVLPWNIIALRVVLKILLMPLVVGIAYEIIKLAGRYDNPVTRVVSAPGMWLQRITTAEPDDSQLEVAIASLLPVIPKDENLDTW